MKDLTCSTKYCKNKVKYQNDLEESFYCKDCAFTMFNLNELTKIGKISDINKMIKINESLLENIRIYINKEQLEHKWRLALEELKLLEDQLLKIKDDTENTLKTDNPNNLAKIQQRSFDLKF